jgi:hypothetical protein
MVISLHKTKIKAWKKIVEEKKKEERERERIGEKTPKKVFNSVEIKLIEEEKVNP